MINFDVLNEFMGNDQDIAEAVLQTYLEEHSHAADELLNCATNNQFTALHRLAHSLKGVLLGFGEDTAVKYLKKIEADSSEGEVCLLDIELVSTELSKINTQISDYLAQL